MLTLTPFWSTQDGYRLTYRLYVNGEKRGTYEYDVTRKVGVWLPLLALVWVNLATYSESEVPIPAKPGSRSDSCRHLIRRMPAGAGLRRGTHCRSDAHPCQRTWGRAAVFASTVFCLRIDSPLSARR
jgi:hypothetical protein